jgi:anti-anti-sigma factor
MGLELKRTETPAGALVIACTGEVDQATAPQLDAAVSAAVEAGRVRLAIDLSGTTYISSAGVGVLVAAQHACTSKKGAFVLVYQRKKDDATGLARGYDVLEVLDLLGLTEQFTIAASQAEAELRLGR